MAKMNRVQVSIECGMQLHIYSLALTGSGTPLKDSGRVSHFKMKKPATAIGPHIQSGYCPFTESLTFSRIEDIVLDLSTQTKLPTLAGLCIYMGYDYFRTSHVSPSNPLRHLPLPTNYSENTFHGVVHSSCPPRGSPKPSLYFEHSVGCLIKGPFFRTFVIIEKLTWK